MVEHERKDGREERYQKGEHDKQDSLVGVIRQHADRILQDHASRRHHDQEDDRLVLGIALATDIDQEEDEECAQHKAVNECRHHGCRRPPCRLEQAETCLCRDGGRQVACHHQGCDGDTQDRDDDDEGRHTLGSHDEEHRKTGEIGCGKRRHVDRHDTAPDTAIGKRTDPCLAYHPVNANADSKQEAQREPCPDIVEHGKQGDRKNHRDEGKIERPHGSQRFHDSRHEDGDDQQSRRRGGVVETDNPARSFPLFEDEREQGHADGKRQRCHERARDDRRNTAPPGAHAPHRT